VGVQMHDGRGKNHQAYLWQYSRPGGPVVFDFRMGREREGPKLLCAIFIVLVALFFSELLRNLPQPVLAAIVLRLSPVC
jgi:hypothetical protein